MRDGFSISVTRTVAADAERSLAAFTDAAIRRRWLPERPDAPAADSGRSCTARFDWSDPPSRLVVNVAPKGAGKALVAVAHEKLPDAEAAERFKARWREWLGRAEGVPRARLIGSTRNCNHGQLIELTCK